MIPGFNELSFYYFVGVKSIVIEPHLLPSTSQAVFSTNVHEDVSPIARINEPIQMQLDDGDELPTVMDIADSNGKTFF